MKRIVSVLSALGILCAGCGRAPRFPPWQSEPSNESPSYQSSITEQGDTCAPNLAGRFRLVSPDDRLEITFAVAPADSGNDFVGQIVGATNDPNYRATVWLRREAAGSPNFVAVGRSRDGRGCVMEARGRYSVACDGQAIDFTISSMVSLNGCQPLASFQGRLIQVP